MAFDDAGKRVVVFGGLDGSNKTLWRYLDMGWTEVGPDCGVRTGGSLQRCDVGWTGKSGVDGWNDFGQSDAFALGGYVAAKRESMDAA